MSELILPPDYIEIKKPLIFLAGPIQSAERWQDEAIKIIRENSDFAVASPRRPGEFEGDFGAEMYNEQVDWETHHLRKAAGNGAIIFWLAKEKSHKCERAYAQTTRFELAEWKVRHERDGVNLVIGIEDGFTNARYIRRRFSQDCPKVKICSTLKETCMAAIGLIESKAAAIEN